MKYGVINLDVWYFMDDSDSIKRDLLLFDKLLIETGKVNLIEKLLTILPNGKHLLRDKLNEIENLEKKGLIEYFDINKFNPSKELLTDTEVKYYFDSYQNSYGQISGIGERNKGKSIIDIYTEFMELDRTGAQFSARYKSMISNSIDSQNEYIPIIKQIDNTNQKDWKTSKESVVHIIIKQFPVIPADLSIEKIIDFKENSDIKNRYYELRDFITNISKSNFTPKEIEDKIEYLQNQYAESLKFYQIKHDTSIFETFCITSAKIIEDITTLKFSEAVKTIFEINKKELLLIEAEKQFKGRELSYLHKVGGLK